jgi:hypothetical protein
VQSPERVYQSGQSGRKSVDALCGQFRPSDIALGVAHKRVLQ